MASIKADALGLCGPVEWSEFFEYTRRIHKKLIDCEAAEAILGYLNINGKKAQITLKAETDELEWIGD